MARRYADFVNVGPATAAGKLLRSFWQPVYVSANLAAGRAVPLRIMDEEFTLYRGKGGRAVLMAPRCAHRGVLLSVGRIEDDCIACLYHGWKYDPSGQCIDQPGEKIGFAGEVKLASYPLREYHGLVFAYLAGGTPPPFPALDVLDSGGTVETFEQRRDFPFFSQVENGADEVHFFFTHRGSVFDQAGLNDEIPEIECDETDWGIVRYGVRGNLVRTSHVLMPNCSYSSIYYGPDKGWSEHIAWRVPIDRETHSTFTINRLHKSPAELENYRRRQKAAAKDAPPLEPANVVVDRILRGEIHVDDVVDRPDALYIQDAVVMKAQGTAIDRNQDRLGISDRQVSLLRRIWTRELDAIAAGRPLKQWRVPSDLAVTKGVEE